MRNNQPQRAATSDAPVFAIASEANAPTGLAGTSPGAIASPGSLASLGCLAIFGFLASFGALTLAPLPAHAIIGGAEDRGPASASTVMVLGSGGAVCSGVVVSRSAVLTAAHCADPNREHRVHFMENGQPVLLTPAASAVHPLYVKDAVQRRRQSIDLALVRLAQPLPARFSPAPLSGGHQPRAGATVTVSGFGAIGRKAADGSFRSVTAPVEEPWGPGKILLWIGSAKGAAAGACAGDSGGPISVNGAVTAITSWSKGVGSTPCGRTTQGVLLAPQRIWIDDTLAGWGLSASWR